MATSIASYQDFKEDMRLDAEYYKDVYLEISKQLLNKPFKFLNEIATLKGGATPFMFQYLDEGIPFFRIQNIGICSLKLHGIACINKKIHQTSLKRSQLKTNDVLFTITGRLGSTAIIPDNFGEANINQHMVRIRVIDNKINPFYLMVFLSSKFGKNQFLRKSYGTTRDALNYTDINDIKVVEISKNNQKKIEKQIKKSYKMFTESKDKIKEAEKILETELNLDKIQTQNNNVTLINYNDFISEMRFDSQYFSSQNLKSIFSGKFQSKPLKQLCEKIETGFTPAKDSYWHKGFPVLKMGCLTNTGIDWSKIEFANGGYFEKTKMYIVEEEDIFLTSSAHALEHIAKKVDIVIGIPKEYQNKLVFVGEIMRLRVKKELINSYYLLLFLKTELGYRLFQNCIRGQTAHIYPKDVENIIIPLISTKKQEEIEILITESRKLLEESTGVINKSINEVEELIENESK